jgi:ribulose-5-phosphate 4-epimerase/fuculose-1-phosphate aldolase
MAVREAVAREQMVELGRSLHQRGYIHGAAGNLSVRLDDGFLVTPTNVCLGRLDPARITKLDADGRHASGDPASKEAFLHLSMLAERPQSGAVAHTHSTHAVAVSILDDRDPQAPIPALTAYQVMRLGHLILLPYYPPGDVSLAGAVREVAAKHHAVLLAHHGPVIAGRDLEAAVYAAEELEETAKLALLVRGERVRVLDADQIADLARRFPS